MNFVVWAESPPKKRGHPPCLLGVASRYACSATRSFLPANPGIPYGIDDEDHNDGINGMPVMKVPVS